MNIFPKNENYVNFENRIIVEHEIEIYPFFPAGNFSSRGSRNGHQTQVASVFNPFAGFGAFGMGNEFDDMFGMNGNSQFSTFTTSSSFGGGVGNGGAVKKTSTSTRFSNGKKITTKK